MHSWWNKRNKNEKLLSGLLAFFLVIILLSAIGSALPESNLTGLGLYNDVNGSSGDYNVQINNSTTEYNIIGEAEANATVIIESTDLKINDTIKIDSKNQFYYKVKIPKNINEAKITITASKKGKDSGYIDLKIIRVFNKPLDKSTENTTVNSLDEPKNTKTFENKWVKFEYPKSLSVMDRSNNKELYVEVYKGSTSDDNNIILWIMSNTGSKEGIINMFESQYPDYSSVSISGNDAVIGKDGDSIQAYIFTDTIIRIDSIPSEESTFNTIKDSLQIK